MNKTSQYPGVSWDKDRNKWRAHITIGGKLQFLGRYDSEIDAKEAYSKAYAEKYATTEGDSDYDGCFSGNFNVVTLGDWHVPFEDTSAIEVVMKFISDIQPNIIIIHEMHDFYTLSRFDKDPNWINCLQDELDSAAKYLSEIRDICPKSRIILLKSNHLDRLRKYLWSKAKGLCSLRALEISALLELDLLDIEYMDEFIYEGVIFKHGSLVSQGAGASGLRELQKENMSGVSGHTHRLAIVYRTDRNNTLFWVENGSLCNQRPDYIEGIPNWKLGFSIISWNKNGIPIPRLVSIVNGTCIL